MEGLGPSIRLLVNTHQKQLFVVTTGNHLLLFNILSTHDMIDLFRDYGLPLIDKPSLKVECEADLGNDKIKRNNVSIMSEKRKKIVQNGYVTQSLL